MVDFLVDGMLSGTGIRDARQGGYVTPAEIGLSDDFSSDLAAWLKCYADAHFEGFLSDQVIMLDREGLVLATRAERELPAKRFGYFSDGEMKLFS